MRTFTLEMVIILAVTGAIATGCAKQTDDAAVVRMLVGTAEVEKGGARRPLAVGDRFGIGDTVRTGPRSAVVATITAKDVDMEIQENAVFTIATLRDDLGDLFIDRGNIWLRVNKKLRKGENLILHSRTVVASVRGTKFYTFTMGDIQGTCMCQGSADYDVTGRKVHRAHDVDHIIATRGDKTIILSPADLRAVTGGRVVNHDHSQIGNSPLGPRASMTPDQMKRMRDLMEKKFAE